MFSPTFSLKKLFQLQLNRGNAILLTGSNNQYEDHEKNTKKKKEKNLQLSRFTGVVCALQEGEKGPILEQISH